MTIEGGICREEIFNYITTSAVPSDKLGRQKTRPEKREVLHNRQSPVQKKLHWLIPKVHWNNQIPIMDVHE